MIDRVTQATDQPRLVISTDGLLATFNDLGVLNPLDVQAAQTIGRMLGEDNESVLLAAALTVRGTRFGHVCIRLDVVRDAVVVDGQDPEEIEQLPWPDIDDWAQSVASSPLVGNGTGDDPLVFEDGRLYLERYYRYEQQVAGQILSRIVPPVRGEGPSGLRPEVGGRSPDGAKIVDQPELEFVRPGLLGEAPSDSEVVDDGDAPIVLPLQRAEGPSGFDSVGDGDAPIVPPRQRGEGPSGRRPEVGGQLHPKTQEMLADLLTPNGSSPTRQHDAALLALTSKVAVIAGGPGTGKTHTIAAMLAALAAGGDFPTVALCAPTGKAAARLGEAINALATELDDPQVTEALATVAPSTIHRLLGWSWDRGRFAHHEKNRLPHDLVIVDEMSMVSLLMAAKLLAAVGDDATVVLVGDPYQLESIEAGTVLADIVGAGQGPDAPIASQVVVLDRVHRFEEDSAIADFAEAVRTGDADAAVELLRSGGEHLGWAEDRKGPTFDEMWSRVLEQRIRMVELASAGRGVEAMSALNSVAVLCARRTGSDGVSVWGREIERALDERFTGLRWGGDWYPGRPVMITKNDYRLELYNGDIGVCVETKDGLRVLFDRDAGRAFPPSHLGLHTTVHAMTIHKSQGSQFDEVVVVLPGESSRLLTRELLYTAVTRASSRVSIVGSEEVVRSAVTRSVQRASGLGDRLRLE
jgi:exodeoxyribonuclease V alpha subunit